MKVLICGGDGFIGSRIAIRLRDQGHHVRIGSRHGSVPDGVAMDFRLLNTPEQWIPLLKEVDAVVNAVGIIREQAHGDFERIHHRAPAALFIACRQMGITHVIQISALGDGDTPYLRTKRAADAVLLNSTPTGVVLRPGLVFGAEGTSTRLFLALASLPIHVHPLGAGPVQPIHVDDVADLVAALLASEHPTCGILDAPGPTPLRYDEWMTAYRRLLDLSPAPAVSMPGWTMSIAARLAGRFPGSLLNGDSWTMLRAGNTGNPAQAETLLARPLRPIGAFLPPAQQEHLRLRALADWRRPLLLAVLASLWILTAMISAFVYPRAGSLELLSPFGLHGLPALAMLYGASTLDLALGIATLRYPCRRLWWGQLLLIAGYTALIAWRLPKFLIHPFGPVLKNLAIAALLLLLLAEEKRP